jgi:hypothetical protein
MILELYGIVAPEYPAEISTFTFPHTSSMMFSFHRQLLFQEPGLEVGLVNFKTV